MTLKTSSRSMSPFWNMIWFTIKKNAGIIIVLCIASLLYYPGTFIVNYDNLITAANLSQENYLLEDFGIAITILSTIVAVFFNMYNFNFLYKKNSSDVFHAFPLTRCELLLSRFLSGLFATLIPTLLCYASFGILMVFNNWMGTFALLLCYLLFNVIIILVCSTFSMIFVVSAGSAFDLGLSLIGGNLALLAVGWILESILSETLIGFSGYHTSDIMYNLSPPYCCGAGLAYVNELTTKGINGQIIEFLVRSVVYIIVFTAVSLILYNRRKAEKGGTAYAYKFMYLGCSLLAGICGGYLLGMIFTGEINSFGFWFFAIVGCLLTSVIYGTITNRGFKGVGKSLIIGGISAVVIISVALSGVTGGFGYTNRIPNADKIESVSVSLFDENIPFDDPQMILDLHQAILNTDATTNNYDVPYYQRQTIHFYYQLENGNYMTREFTVMESKVAKQLLAIYKSEERLNMMKEHINTEGAEHISLYFNYDESYYSADITESEVGEFLNAYWSDVQNSDASIFDTDTYQFIELSCDKRSYDNRNEYFSFSFEHHESFINTNQFILEHNLVERAQDEDK